MARERHRRPSGEPPPLPRSEGWGRIVVLFAVVLAVALLIDILLRTVLPGDVGASALTFVRDHAPSWLVTLAERLDVVGGVTVIVLLRLVAVAVAVVYRRWRQIVVALATFVVTDWIVLRVVGFDRDVPDGLTPLTDRATFAFPSRPVAALAVTLAGMTFLLAPAGSARRTTLWIVAAVSVVFAAARVVLLADYPLDAGYAVLLGHTAALAAFAAFVPDDVFPVRYARGGTAAHLDLGGPRATAIVTAMSNQLGLTVVEIEPFGLEGSGGSSPLRMRTEELEGHLFAKIYSTSHARADRWYRIGRTILYGQLEDEVPFRSVRRLVAYEDYALRLMDDLGFRVARTYGFAELTPNREYMLVTEFFEGSKTLGESRIDDDVIDEGLQLVKRMWDEGLAHRDLKPANLLVKDGHLQLVDVSGLEVRPSPWRQAVDLANMMLTLALQSDADRVYERATHVFSPDEIAEAFAANVGMAMPTQVQARLKEDPRPLLERFKELAPAHAPVSIQRWSVNRLALIAGAVGGAVVLALMFVDALRAGVKG